MPKKRDTKFYERTYQAVWNQYLFLVSSRERLEHKFNIILVVASLLLVVFSYCDLFKDKVFMIPAIIIVSFIFLLTLYYVVVRIIMVPWVEKPDFEKLRKKNDASAFFKTLTDDVYKYIGDIRVFNRSRENILKIQTTLLLLLFFLPFVIHFYKENITTFYCSVLALLIVIGMFSTVWYKPMVKR
ncbi:hypothetical protein JXB31_05595 [Candidatus Woesearchaeota archaeon]|nr:hypothetical protein [Candidatus Woesearchaeota archaeon]